MLKNIKNIKKKKFRTHQIDEFLIEHKNVFILIYKK